MWSKFDTLILVSGVILCLVPFVPMPEIKLGRRLGYGLTGAAIIIVAIVLGSMESFTYPSFVYVGPLIAIGMDALVIKDAREVRRREALTLASSPTDFIALQPGVQQHESEQQGTRTQGYTANPVASVNPVSRPVASVNPVSRPVASVNPVSRPAANVNPVASSKQDFASPQQSFQGSGSSEAYRKAAWAELFEPTTSPERLFAISQTFPEFAAQIAVHPQAYPELREWARTVEGLL